MTSEKISTLGSTGANRKGKTFLLVIIGVLAALSSTGSTSAEPQGWGNDTRITFAPENSWYPSLATDREGNVHIAWMDSRDSPLPLMYEIYYKKLDNNGVSLTPEIRITFNSSHDSAYPSLATDYLGNIHVVWHETRNGNWEIYYKKLDNNGTGLTPDTRLTFHPAVSYFPSLATDLQGNIHVAWEDSRDGYNPNPEVYYKKLNNSGSIITPDIMLTPYGSWDPSIATDRQNNVHVAWRDYRAGNLEIYYKKLNNSGGNLTGDIRVSFNAANSVTPSLATDSTGSVHVVWEDSRDGNRDVYYKKLNNNGMNLTPEIRLTFNASDSVAPSIATDIAGNVYVAWTDTRDGNTEIYYRKLNNTGVSLTNETRLTFNRYFSGYPSIATDPMNNVHVAWRDDRDGTPTWSEIYYKRTLQEPLVPVLLVHGIYSNDTIWNDVAPALRNAGFIVYRIGEVLNKSGLIPSNGDLTIAASSVRQALNEVKSRTGSSKVHVVAHSTGGLAVRWYIRSLSYQNDIEKLITLGTPHKGTPIAVVPIGRLFGVTPGARNDTIRSDTARIQIIPNSFFLRVLNMYSDYRGVAHTAIGGTRRNPIVLQMFYRLMSTISDSIVPLSSVNVPDTTCYKSDVVHTIQLGPAYYTHQPTIQAIVDVLKDRSLNLARCPQQDEDQDPQQNLQVLSFNSSINPNEVQTIASGLDLGKQSGVLLIWSGGELHIELVSPSGASINATNYPSFPNVTFSSETSFGASFEWFMLEQPEQGNWTIKAHGSNISSPTAYEASIIMEKDVSIDLASDKAVYDPNQTLYLTVRLANASAPVLNASVTAKITKPDDGIAELVLFDDGNHNDTMPDDGVYGNSFSDTGLEGLYLIGANASVSNTFEIRDSTTVFVELSPDIAVDESGIVFSPSELMPGQDSAINVSAVISNIGRKDAENVTVEFYDGNPAHGRLFGSAVVYYLPVNGSAVASAMFEHRFMSNASLKISGLARVNSTVNASIIDSGFKSRYINVIVSQFSGFLESNYSNNAVNKSLRFKNSTYVLAMAFGSVPGIPLGDGRIIPLNPDPLLFLSVQFPAAIGLFNSVGVLAGEGLAPATWAIPYYIPPGLTIYLAFVVINPELPFPQTITSISNAVPITVMQ